LLRGAGSPQPRAELKTRWIAGGRRLASPIDGQEAIDPICRAGAASRPRWGLAEVDCLVPAGVTGEAGSCVTGSDGRRPDQQAEHVWRAQVVLMPADRAGTIEIMRQTRLYKPSVCRWRKPLTRTQAGCLPLLRRVPAGDLHLRRNVHRKAQAVRLEGRSQGHHRCRPACPSRAGTNPLASGGNSSSSGKRLYPCRVVAKG
jgi:hypothetical protein